MKKLLIPLILLCLFAGTASAAARTIDCTGGYTDYAMQVSAYNNKFMLTSAPGAKGSPARMYTNILMKTDGTEQDLTVYGAAVVIAGPADRYTLLFRKRDDALKALPALLDKDVIYAEEDSVISAMDTAPTEEITFLNTGTAEMGFDKMLSWARRDGTHSVKVGLVDSGVYPNAQLSGRVISGPDLVDHDDDPTNDEFGHGTHLAGIIAGCTDGCPVTIYNVRVLDDQGNGYISDVTNGILTAAENGATVINLSLGMYAQSDTVDDAVLSALSSGCTVVIAAGNNGVNTETICPGHLMNSGVIVTGAAAASGSRASFSNFGASVDLYTYGVAVSSCANNGSGYRNNSGTSQAAAYTSAACALLEVLNGHMAPSRIESTLKSVLTGTPVPIPRLDRLVPQYLAFHLETLRLKTGETLALPVSAYPLTCGRTAAVVSNAPGVITADENGLLTAVSAGSAVLTVTCPNFGTADIGVTVTENDPAVFTLPDGLTRLDEECYYGTFPDRIIVPAELALIAEDAFSADPLFLCGINETAAEICESEGMQYVFTPAEE